VARALLMNDLMIASNPTLHSTVVPHAAPEQKDVTLAFTDVVSFTRLTRRLGDAAAYDVMSVHNTLVRREVSRVGGREVERLGDGFLLAFDAPEIGIKCAIAIQRACEQQRQRSMAGMQVRIGLHAGTAIRDGDRYFGEAVILCARIASEARPDEILCSATVRDAACLSHTRFLAARCARLKGFDDLQRVHPLAWTREPRLDWREESGPGSRAVRLPTCRVVPAQGGWH